MSISTKRIGEISVKEGREIEWTIQDIFQYTTTVDEHYKSPSFDVSGCRWYLAMLPNGETTNNTIGWIYVCLYSEDDHSPQQSASYNFGLKRADGTVEIFTNDIPWVFDAKGAVPACPIVKHRSELLRRKSELAPSDALTVTCSLRMYEGLHSSASTDTLSRDLLDMFNSKRGCDATLKVKQEEFPVHKCILAARSPVFAAMFEVDMREKQTGVVDIVDCDPEAFKDFLKYLYSGKAENRQSNAFEVYKIADKYGVGDLKPACITYIMRNLTVECVLDAMILGDEFSEESLKLKTQKFFNENFSEIFSTAGWESFMKQNSHLATELLQNMASEIKLKKRSLCASCAK